MTALEQDRKTKQRCKRCGVSLVDAPPELASDTVLCKPHARNAKSRQQRLRERRRSTRIVSLPVTALSAAA